MPPLLTILIWRMMKLNSDAGYKELEDALILEIGDLKVSRHPFNISESKYELQIPPLCDKEIAKVVKQDINRLKFIEWISDMLLT